MRSGNLPRAIILPCVIAVAFLAAGLWRAPLPAQVQDSEHRLVTRETSLGKPPAEFFTLTLPGEHMDYSMPLILPVEPSWAGVAGVAGGLLAKSIFGAIMAIGQGKREAREAAQIAKFNEIGLGSLRISPDSKRVAYGAARGDKRVIVVNGVDGKEYDTIAMGSLFSRDGKRFAYAAKRGERWVVVVDGVEVGEYERIADEPEFAPGSMRLAYSARRGGKWVSVLDGMGGKEYDELVPEPGFSRDGKCFTYKAKRGDKWMYVLNGVEGKEYDSVGHFPELKIPQFSPDGKRFAHAAKRGEKWMYVVNGVEGKEYDDVEVAPGFSPDGKRFAYTAKRGEKWAVVVDAVEGPEYDRIVRAPVFSPDSTRLAYLAKRGEKWAIVVNGVEQKAYSLPILRQPVFRTKIRIDDEVIATSSFLQPIFSPDSKHVGYPALSGSKAVLVVDGVEGKEYLQTYPPTFSPDSKRVAYVAMVRLSKVSGSCKAAVVVDGVEGKEYRQVTPPIFSPDSRRVAYAAMVRGKVPCIVVRGESAGSHSGGKWVTVVDGVEGKEYDDVQDVGFSPDTSRLTYAARRDKKWVVVEEVVEGKEYDDIFDIFLANLAGLASAQVLSPDGKHAAYTAARGGKSFIVVNGIEGKEYDYLSPPVFDSPASLHTVGRRDQEFFRLEIEIPQ